MDLKKIKNRDSSAGIATGWTALVRFPEGKHFSPPQRPDRLWGPPSLLSN
jgi:hypothetical protein